MDPRSCSWHAYIYGTAVVHGEPKEDCICRSRTDLKIQEAETRKVGSAELDRPDTVCELTPHRVLCLSSYIVRLHWLRLVDARSQPPKTFSSHFGGYSQSTHSTAASRHKQETCISSMYSSTKHLPVNFMQHCIFRDYFPVFGFATDRAYERGRLAIISRHYMVWY